MRRYVGPLIALAVFVILLAIVLLTQNNGGSSTAAVVTPSATIDPNLQIINLPSSDAVSEVDIQSITTTVKLKINNGAWQQIAPTTQLVDSPTVSDTVQQLTNWTGSTIISSSLASNLATYGLDKPSLTVTIVANSGPKVLQFGSLNPATNNYYVKRSDDPRVWTVSAFVINTLTTWETAIPTAQPTVGVTGSPLTPLPTFTPSPSPAPSTEAATVATTPALTPAATSAAGPTGSPGVGVTLAPSTVTTTP